MSYRILFLTIPFFLLISTAQAAPLAPKSKDLVVAFYRLTFLDHHPDEAAEKYLGEVYIQHNPNISDGKKAFIDFFTPFFKKNPEARSEIKQVFTDGKFVILHVLSKLDQYDRGNAVVDIFKVEHGKIVEHWDVRQEIPKSSANQNSMF